MTNAWRILIVLALGLVPMVFAAAAEGTIELVQGWRFAPDPDEVGLQEGWHSPDYDDSGWATLDAEKRWEDQGFAEVDGTAWYRKEVFVPEDLRAERIWLNLGGLNDCGTVFCNGQKVGSFGDHSRLSVADCPLAADLTQAIRWGAVNLIAIQAFDWGDSGGLWRSPCNLTTDKDALAVSSLLCIVPGFDGRPTVLGLEPTSFGIHVGDPVRFSVELDDGSRQTQETQTGVTHSGRPIAAARFELEPRPGRKMIARAEVPARGGLSSVGTTLEAAYVWPEPPAWPEEGSKLRVLNNFVTELARVAGLDSDAASCSFLNPREGWVFIRLSGNEEPAAFLDDGEEPIIWRRHPETQAWEAMRELEKGRHTIRVEGAAGSALDIRAVPEIAFCYWPTHAVVKALKKRDRAFAERYVFPNVNVLITHDDMDPEFFDSWRAEGRSWISNSSLPGLNSDEAPSADQVYAKWGSNACVTRPGYSGIIVDEFLSNPPGHYAAWTAAMERLYENPAFAGQTYYAWVGDTFRHGPGLAFMQRLFDLGGRFPWEQYFHEEPSEDLAYLGVYLDLRTLEEWNEAMPGVKERVLVCLGAFTTPTCSLNVNPGVNYIPYVDMQYHFLATDPLFFGLRGAFEYSVHYMDDDVLQYAMRLYRHYCIEGARAPYADYPYMLTHLRNADFVDGLDGWKAEPGQTEGIGTAHLRGLGRLQGRWASVGTGDHCAVMVCGEAAQNRLSQTIQDLEPGRLYSIKCIAANLDDLHTEVPLGPWPVLQGAEVVDQGTFREVMPSSYAMAHPDDFEVKLDRMAFTTYSQTMFRPEGRTVELTLSDWKNGAPANPLGQRIGFNFIEVQPIFE